MSEQDNQNPKRVQLFGVVGLLYMVIGGILVGLASMIAHHAGPGWGYVIPAIAVIACAIAGVYGGYCIHTMERVKDA